MTTAPIFLFSVSLSSKMWTITLLAILIALFLLWRKRKFSYFKELGIPGPEPNILFGNILEIFRKDDIQCHQEWIAKYGKIIGYYYGTKPVLLIADLELLKKIEVSDFHKFMNRPNIARDDSQLNKKPRRIVGFSQHLIRLRDKRWKEIRSLITPSFTTSKMKQMAPIMNGAINTLLEHVEKKSQSDESFDIYPMYQGLTMDVIGRTAFGIQTNVQNDSDDVLLRTAKILFAGNDKNPISMLAVSFRKLQSFWSWIGRLKLSMQNKGIDPISELIGTVQYVIKQRRTDKSARRTDLLQLMMDAEVDLSALSANDLTATGDSTAEKNTAAASTPGKLAKMTDDDILDNSVLFFLAGYETTSTALAFTTHLLVHYEDVQEKVRQEVLELLEKEGELDYYSVSKLQYLDQVLNESLRMYPPVCLFVNRECGEDITLGNMKLKKGLAIQVPVYNLHRDPELWPQPNEFKPERFSPENKKHNHPLAFQPFGAGPRNCVGMRFALMEAKLALAKLLSKYRLKPCAETDKEPATVKVSIAIMNPLKGVHLKAIPI